MHLRRRSPQATSFSASGNSVYLHAHSNSVAGHASAKRGGLDFRDIVIDHLRELTVLRTGAEANESTPRWRRKRVESPGTKYRATYWGDASAACALLPSAETTPLSPNWRGFPLSGAMPRHYSGGRVFVGLRGMNPLGGGGSTPGGRSTTIGSVPSWTANVT
jgi:hypothetical protein